MKNKIDKIEENIENEIEITNGENLFEDLGFSKRQSISLKMKSDLYARIISVVRENAYTQHKVSMILDIPQPKVSNILRGKIDGISIELLLEYAHRLDSTLRVELVSERRTQAG